MIKVTLKKISILKKYELLKRGVKVNELANLLEQKQ